MHRPVAIAALLALVAGCSGSEDPESASGAGAERETTIEVVTTVAPITSIAASVIGDNAAVTGVVPEGTNSHTFEPRPSDAEALEAADVLFMNGLRLEEPTRELAESVMSDDAEIVELGEVTIGEDEWIYDFSFPADGGKPNPHLWTNPPMAVAYAEAIRDEMSELDPDNAAEYEANAAVFAEEVEQLDEAMRTAFETIPGQNKQLLTYHDAYAYFADEYGFEVIGAIQPSTFDAPTAAEVGRLIEQVQHTGVPAIFGSEVFPSDVLEQIGAETGVRYVDVLRDDDLPGEPGDPEHSWYGLMRFNFATMTEALGGDPAALLELDVAEPGADSATYAQ